MHIWPFWIEINELGDNTLCLIQYRWWAPVAMANVSVEYSANSAPMFYWISDTGTRKYVSYPKDKPFYAALYRWDKKGDAKRVKDNKRREKELHDEYLKSVLKKPVELPPARISRSRHEQSKP